MCQSTKVGRKNKKKLVQDGFFTKTFTVWDITRICKPYCIFSSTEPSSTGRTLF
jgi:hypothetical protein